MSVVRLVAATAAIGSALVLAGCSGSSSSMPDWLQFKPPPPPLETLRFESDPPDAEVRTAQGQTCRTPCSLALPLAGQSITFSKKGYAPQTVQVDLRQSGERSNTDGSLPAPTFAANPVEVALQAATPAGKPAAKPKPRRVAAGSKAAANKLAERPMLNSTSPPSPPADSFQPAPATVQAPAASPFPPPPPTR